MKSWKRLTASALAVAVAMSGLGITGNVWKGKQAQAKERTETVYEGDGYKVTYSVEGKWENGYNGSVIIANTGDRTIENWELAYKTKDEYKDVWNAETTYHIEGFYSIKNNKANADIEPGQEVNYGFKANCKGAVDFPEEFTLVGVDSEVPKENVEVTSEVTEQWEKGATVNIHIKNISEEDIESWKLEFQVLGTVGSVWDAKLVSQEHGKVKVKSYGYNSYIHPGETETIGIQIQMDEAAAFAEPGEFSVYEHKKEKIVLDFDKEWNRSMVRADAEVVKEAVEKNKYAVNVGLIDSGVNYSANINVVARKNFVEDYDDLNPVFSDLSGHGTAVAGILASSGEEIEGEYKFDKIIPEDSELQDKISGINPYVNLYSAGVLDDNNKATVERVIKGIEWAVANECKIIHISCGFDKDSEELHKVIKEAYDNGVLFVAPAGNEGSVKYPARYPEVMAVGSLNCNAELAEDSSTGKSIEVVAPGEDVAAYGFMDILENDSGTSMAAPQVTALAAMLWQQDLSKSNIFIRNLIDATANNLGDKEAYGYGLIDCEKALQEHKGMEMASLDNIRSDDNDSPYICTDKEELEGFWKGAGHEKTMTLSGKKHPLMMDGVKWPDSVKSGVDIATNNPEFHGFYKSQKEPVNYIASAVYMTKLSGMASKKDAWKDNKDGLYKVNADDFRRRLKLSVKKYFELHGKKANLADEGELIFGMALHTVADMYAHSAWGLKIHKAERTSTDINFLLKKWQLLNHDKDSSAIPYADDEDYIPERYLSAQNVCKAMIDTAWLNHKEMNKILYCRTEHYKYADYKEKNDRLKYLKHAYTLMKFEDFIKPTTTDLIKLCNQIDGEKIRGKIMGWEEKIVY